MSLNGTFGWYQYTMDRGDAVIVKLSPEVAAVGGFTAASGPPPSSGKAWPFHEKHLRHVDAYVIRSGRRYYERFPMATLTQANYIGGATFTYKGETWVVEGTTGEHLDGRNVPPQE